MHRNLSLLGVAAVMVVSTAANAAMVRESFNAGLGQFDLVVNLPGEGSDFGFSNTSNAGGSAGELGGTLARTDVARYVADGTLGGDLTTNEELTMSGQFMLEDINFDGTFFFGYFNTSTFAERSAFPSPGMGFFFFEPGGSSGGGFRVQIVAGGSATGKNAPPHAPVDQVVNFSLTFTPSGNGDGSGTLSGYIGSEDVTDDIGPNDDVYDAFGLGVGFQSATAINAANVYFDNLQYTAVVAAGGDIAHSPSPEDEAKDVLRDGALGWQPGELANTHDVYFGTVFDDVNNATTTFDPAAVYMGRQSESTYVPRRLDLGRTYYWRVDEVTAPPDYTIFRGDVWSFTVEPEGVLLASELITVTASSVDSSQIDPNATINGTGLDEKNLHNNEKTAMWLCSVADPEPWIQYDFDKAYKLHDMVVWNHNSDSELTLGYGIRQARIETSVDGETWTELDGLQTFNQAPGTPGYAANTTVSLGGVIAQAVRITALSNWSSWPEIFTQKGLSEVQFSYVLVWARTPDPNSGATDVGVDVILGWRAGREADKHDVYLSTDEQAVIYGTAPVTTVTETSYRASLDVDSTYYWRVDEVNDAETPTTWQGEIWNLSTPEYLVVDDFESYNEIPAGEEGSNLVYLTWIDGFDNPSGNGSTMGHTVPFEPSMESVTVYDGSQSAPLYYDNSTASLSEVTANTSDLAIGRDWTVGSPQTLVLWVYGAIDNAPQQMYVKVGSAKVLYDGDITIPMWRQWNIDLAGLGINLSNVAQLAIGLERIGATGGSGMVFVDEIRLYRQSPAIPIEEVWIEAEAGALGASLKTFDDPTAMGGKSIGSEDGDENSTGVAPGPEWIATYTFDVAGGDYKVYIRAQRATSDSFWVRITTATGQNFEDPDQPGTGWVDANQLAVPVAPAWGWDDVHSNNHGNQAAIWTLPAGTQTLQIAKRDDGVRLDAIVITDLLE